jgi:hypothetical protein
VLCTRTGGARRQRLSRRNVELAAVSASRPYRALPRSTLTTTSTGRADVVTFDFSVTNPYVVVGLLFGGLLPYLFGAMGMTAADRVSDQPGAARSFRSRHMPQGLALVLHSMLATGNSAVVAVDRFKESGAKTVRITCLLATTQAIEKVRANHPDVHVWISATDEAINEAGYNLPGPDDVGDRMFDTR